MSVIRDWGLGIEDCVVFCVNTLGESKPAPDVFCSAESKRTIALSGSTRLKKPARKYDTLSLRFVSKPACFNCSNIQRG